MPSESSSSSSIDSSSSSSIDSSSSSSSIDSSSSSSIDSSSSSSSSSLDSSSSSSSSISSDSSSSSSSISSESSSSSSSSISSESSSSSSSSSISSSSSSSSSYSSSSSSSSNDFPNNRNLQNVIVTNTEHHDIIPFTFTAQYGTSTDLGDDSKISFTIEGSSTVELDYEAILNRDNGSLLTSEDENITVYVPEDERSKYKHNETFYVDIIAKDTSGIKSVRTHVEPDKYQFEDITDEDHVFYIPKFTWDSANVSSTTTTTTTPFSRDIMWVGSEDGTLNGITYGTESVNVFSTQSLTDPVGKIAFGDDNHFMYVSTVNNLYKYGVDNFEDSSKVIEEILSVSNEEKMVIDTYRYSDDSVWAVDSYMGRVFKLDPEDLSIQETYEDFASPFKIRYSTYHDVCFVADSYILWQIDASGNVEVVYEVNDYKLVDFDVSENGMICLIMDGTSKDVIRILDNDKYTFILDQDITDSNLRFCTDCGEGRFYVLGEIDTEGSVYSSSHYVFDVSENTLTKTDSSEALSLTTTTTTLGVTAKAVEVTEPESGDEVQIGTEYQIRWISSKAASDLVKIDLYKGGALYDNIIESTENIGIYAWTSPSNIDEGSNYQFRVTWVSASDDANNYDDSSYFSIVETLSSTTTTTTATQTDSAIGIAYERESDQVVSMLRSGLYMIFKLSDSTMYGLIDSEVSNVLSVGAKGYFVVPPSTQTKVRVFVGSERNYSDRWDSGIVETELKSMYYGGGDDLENGKKYYVHVQTYSEANGWGELQIQEFVMVK